jgi:hypothetical protein
LTIYNSVHGIKIRCLTTWRRPNSALKEDCLEQPELFAEAGAHPGKVVRFPGF